MKRSEQSTPFVTEAPRILESPEEVLSTLGADGKRRWIYPVSSPGRYFNWRRIVGYVLVVLYLALPVIHIGGKPAVMLDFVHREFALFGLTFYPTDTLLLLGFGVSMVLVVIIGTALLGRVWCGWACPQTVYLEFVFRPIERLIEGKEHVRSRRDAGPMNWDKAWRKGLKLSIYLLIALLLAHTFVAYFVGWQTLIDWMLDPPGEHFGFFGMMALTTGLILYDFGYFREQMCTIACPYARMQSVLLDPDSLIVSYDPGRGEPRAKRSRKTMEEEAAGVRPAQGDCIDCLACVRTCPTGIDIRNGLQMECIACTQCIDACDSIMDKIGKPRGLVRYTSEHALAGKESRLFRPRTILYTLLIGLVSTLFVVGLVLRSDYDINVGRVTGSPFTELPDGSIANRLRFRVRNQTGATTTMTITGLPKDQIEMRFVGVHPMPIQPGEMIRLEAWVVVQPDYFKTSTSRETTFDVSFSDGVTETVSFPLLGPSAHEPANN
ncbi:MAG: cytochrome c oxidase accessory protein CcoG [Rhodothermales bacterium]